MNPQDPTLSTPQTSQAADPLAQLQDIHLPPDIGLWPPAWGWWLLAFLLISFLGALIFFVRQHKTRNAYRAPALNELNRLNKEYPHEQNAEYLQGVSMVLRRTALSGFENQFDPSLKGNAWLEWLDNQCPKAQQQFSKGVGTTLLIGPYQKSPEFDRAQLHNLCMLWIKEHRNRWQQTHKINAKQEAKRV